MSEYSKLKKINTTPRLPLEGNLDITYRCNNNCLHCWLRISPDSPDKQRELIFDEIKSIADQARGMGCRKWNISGGEPMLRPDFQDIFDYITTRSIGYTLNTNGTLITPEIAQLLRRKGIKLIALYGATKETYDCVTRHPGGFEMAMQGIRYLQEAGAGFMIQLVPVRANWHEWEKMKRLAESLSKHWRVGAPLLYLSACRDSVRNAEIEGQRLDPGDAADLDQPDMSGEDIGAGEYRHVRNDDRLFAVCVAGRSVFHVDPYGGMTFCSYLKEPSMRFDLRRGSFQDAWETFIPSLADRVRAEGEYRENCGACEHRDDCSWCPVFGWLERGRYSAPVDYLCGIARERERFREHWKANHRRFYRVAGITIQVDSDLAIDDKTFLPKFDFFRAEGPGEDTVKIHHHFSLPDLGMFPPGRELYRRAPWAISRRNGSFIYLGISNRPSDPSLHRVAAFNTGHTRARIYNDGESIWREGGHDSLTLFPTDQIIIARLLADRGGCFLHSAGVVFDGTGVLFVGHSEAGKSTMTRILIDAGQRENIPIEILCDDRNIVRRLDDGWRVYGSWSHGTVPVVSGIDAPLRAVCFLEKSEENAVAALNDRNIIRRRLLACVIKPLVTADWWNKTLDVIEQLAREGSFYQVRFDKSGQVFKHLKGVLSPVPIHHASKRSKK